MAYTTTFVILLLVHALASLSCLAPARGSSICMYNCDILHAVALLFFSFSFFVKRAQCSFLHMVARENQTGEYLGKHRKFFKAIARETFFRCDIRGFLVQSVSQRACIAHFPTSNVSNFSISILVFKLYTYAESFLIQTSISSYHKNLHQIRLT